MISNKLILLFGLLIVIIIVGMLISSSGNNKEHYYSYYKDKQKIGWKAKGELDNGKQPRSTWRSQDLNYETCYGTKDVLANNVPRTGTFFCDNKNLGENTPLSGLYPIDFSNYNIAYQKIAKGKRITGTLTVEGSTYTFDEFGRPTNEHLTLKRSKEICDALGTKCAGFILEYPGKRDNYQARHTYFYSKFDDGFEDPNTYDMNTDNEFRSKDKYHLTSWYQFDTYRKLDPYYKEVPMKEMNSNQQYTKRTCSIEQNTDYDLDYMTGTLDDCVARCETYDYCTGFNRDANAKDDEVAACQLKKVSFENKVPICPKDYMVRGDECIKGWTWNCDENCARQLCAESNGTWIPKDYRKEPYTCKMAPGSTKSVCENTPNRRGLVSYSRNGYQTPTSNKCVSKLTENGYIEGDNLACFSKTPLEDVINTCCSNQNCKGFSYGKDPNRSTYQAGCYKTNLYKFINKSNDYDGYFKPDVKVPY